MSQNDYRYQVHTFGCKVNTYDAGLIQKNLNQNGFLLNKKTDENPPKIHVLNTCAVTQEATKEAVKLIRRLKSKNPFSTIVVTGCAAQVDTNYFENLPAVDIIVANSHKSELPFIIDKFFKGEIKDKVFKSNIFKKEDLEAGGGFEAHHTRTFLKIQDGCNSFCTYCVIPYARGKSRSISIHDLVKKVNEIYEAGHREVVLTGVHIGDYEDVVMGEKKSLEDLVEALLKRTQMPRFRLSSLEPVELTDRLVELYQDKRMCPHFHMSIQSANTEVLALMKRKYTQDDVSKALNTIDQKIKNAFVGMDVIVGFNGETHEHFEDTYLTLSELPWTKIHVFPYSERQGTRALGMADVVPTIERQRRSERLRELSHHRFEEMAQRQLSDVKEILILNKPAHGAQSLSHDYWPVKVNLTENQKLSAGSLYTAKILSYQKAGMGKSEGYLEGVLV